MEKLLYLISVLLLAASGTAAIFNVELIRTTPTVTFATAANLMIFPGNLLLQSVIFLSLGLIFRKLNRLLRRPNFSDVETSGEDYRQRY